MEFDIRVIQSSHFIEPDDLQLRLWRAVNLRIIHHDSPPHMN